MRKKGLFSLRLMWLLPLLLLGACAKNSPSVPVEPPRIPALPMEARQPSPPLFCTPSCLIGLTVERKSWQKRLTEDE